MNELYKEKGSRLSSKFQETFSAISATRSYGSNPRDNQSSLKQFVEES